MSVSPSPSPRRSRFTRDPSVRRQRPFASIEQGLAILRQLDRHLFLTNDQIETLLFRHGTTRSGKLRAPRGAAYAANTALRQLFDSGYVERVPVFLPARRHAAVKAHYVNVLSSRGARLVGQELQERGLSPRWRRALLPRPWQPLLHGFWIREVAVQGQSAVTAQGWRWWSWLDDRQLAGLKKERGARFTTIPDGFFLVTEPESGKHFPQFLEIDLGTQTVSARSPRRLDWRRKIAGYLTYFDRDFREQFGLPTLPLVLTVTESEQRLANLLAATGAAGGGGRFWFTTLDRLFPAQADGVAGGQTSPSAALHAPFLASIWRVPSQEGFRSLADRFGPSRRLA